MANHTPGPWQIDAAHPLWIRSTEGHVVAESPSDFVHHKGLLVAEANARLIAAAPEMLEALESLCRNHNGGDGCTCVGCIAIQKARGPQ